MTARIITGSKLEIARKIADPEGDVREAIVFVEEPIEAPNVPRRLRTRMTFSPRWSRTWFT